MKQVMKYCLLVMFACMTVLMCDAKMIHIDVKNIKGDLTMKLRDMCAAASYNDTVSLYFNEGTYTIDGTIVFRCHVIMRGEGRSKSIIMLDNGKDRAGKKAFPDDTFFKVYGVLAHPITVSISDLAFKIKDHKGIWWEGKGIERYAVKIYHGTRVDIHDVDSYLHNANITNFNLHVCSNVTITNCQITNYNNSETGGCLWVRGEMHNVLIKGNKFYKYGKDETLAIFDRLVDHTNKYIRGKATRTNIVVENNEFYYGGYKGKDKNPEANCGMVFSLFTDHRKSDDKCTTKDFYLRNNKFYISDVTTRCMYIGFDPADVHENIHIENNEIVNSRIGRDYKFYHNDIEIHDLSSCNDTIYVTGNNVKNEHALLNSHGTTGYTFLQLRGGNVAIDRNTVVNKVSTNPSNGKAYGVQLLWCQFEGGTATLTNNVCKGLKCVATVGGGDGTPLFTLNAFNNYFEGDTRVYSHKIKEMHLNFTRNTFKSNNMNFFLQEFPPKGSVVFNNNEVTVSQGNGQFMTHYSSTPTSSMHFQLLEVQNNVFRGVKSEKDMFKNITKVSKRSLRNNSYSRY